MASTAWRYSSSTLTLLVSMPWTISIARRFCLIDFNPGGFLWAAARVTVEGN
jgi:hypothetical protein